MIPARFRLLSDLIGPGVCALAGLVIVGIAIDGRATTLDDQLYCGGYCLGRALKDVSAALNAADRQYGGTAGDATVDGHADSITQSKITSTGGLASGAATSNQRALGHRRKRRSHVRCCLA